MGTSRDANDPRDELRAMNKQARGEFEREQEGDTGGQEHASRTDREASPPARRAVETAREAGREPRPRGDAGRGEDARRTAGPSPRPAPVDRDEE